MWLLQATTTIDIQGHLESIPQGEQMTGSSMTQLVITLVEGAILVGVVLLIYIFIAGFRMVSQPGNKGTTDSARKSLTYAVTGFLLLFASYWIMQIVEFYTGVSILGR